MQKKNFQFSPGDCVTWKGFSKKTSLKHNLIGVIFSKNFLCSRATAQGSWPKARSMRDCFFFLASCGSPEKNTDVNDQASIPQEEVEKIKTLLDSLVIKNIEKDAIDRTIKEKYPILSKYTEEFVFLSKTTVYLYYEGLSSGGLWDKPGARNFGGLRIADISFANGPVPAECVAQKSLEGGRNYFYIILENGLQGWMGRPYIMKDKKGKEFLMPNPLTGEKIRENLEVNYDFLTQDNFSRNNYERYIPSYDSINWDRNIPERYRVEGYRMYEQAMLDGYDQFDSLVSQYMGY